jgi:hypothetical protein
MPPWLQRVDPGLLLGQQLSSELADRRHAALLSLGGGECAASAVRADITLTKATSSAAP